jgi:DNA-binding response OmpR family regulator
MPIERRRLVLVAEDNDSTRSALERFLRLRGYEVIAARTVDDALDALLVHRPAAVITELVLPGGTGRDIVVSAPPRVPVVMFTARPDESSQLERLRPRTTLVAKPYSLVMLIELLDEMLARAEALP